MQTSMIPTIAWCDIFVDYFFFKKADSLCLWFKDIHEKSFFFNSTLHFYQLEVEELHHEPQEKENSFPSPIFPSAPWAFSSLRQILPIRCHQGLDMPSQHGCWLEFWELIAFMSIQNGTGWYSGQNQDDSYVRYCQHIERVVGKTPVSSVMYKA